MLAINLLVQYSIIFLFIYLTLFKTFSFLFMSIGNILCIAAEP